MEYHCQPPDPNDKEAWRQWTKCHLIAAVVILILVGIVLLLKELL